MLKKIFTICLGLVISILVFFIAVKSAENKPFWNDEGYDIVSLFSETFSQILTGHTAQPNNNPLYSFLQKTIILVTYQDYSSLLVNFRLISIVSASFLVLMLFYFMARRFNLFWAIFASLALINQGLFFNYAAECRHYMLWLLCFTMLVLSSTAMCQKRYQDSTWKQRICFIIATVLTTLVISMGIIQVVAATIVCLICWHFLYPRQDKRSNAALWFAFAIILANVCIEAFYVMNKSTPFNNFSGSSWDLLANMQKGDFSLLKLPPRLLFPLFHRDAYLGILLSNMLALIGLLTPILLWKRRRYLNATTSWALILSMATSIQVMATIMIAGIIAVSHFYFIQRIFLYLIVCHSLLAVCGGVVISEFIAHRVPSQFLKLKEFFKYFVLIVLIVLSYQWLARIPDAGVKFKNCGEFVNAKLSDEMQLIGKNEFHFGGLNFIVEVGKRVKGCPGMTQGLHLWQNEKKEWFLTEQVPAQGKEIKLFNNEPVIFY